MRRNTATISPVAEHVYLVGENNNANDSGDTTNDHKKKTRPIVSLLRYCCEGASIFIVAFLLATVVHSGYTGLSKSIPNQDAPTAISTRGAVSSSTAAGGATTNTAPKCTDAQLSRIREQLNPAHIDCGDAPWTQQCPITTATKCFLPTWLTSYYSKSGIISTSSNSFVAITVGCNAGYDSVDLLRMGTFDPSVDVSAWKAALGNAQLPTYGCGREDPSHQIVVPAGNTPRRKGFVYCIEENPATAEAINKTSATADYYSKGLRVVNQVVTKSLDAFVEANVPAGGNIQVLEVKNGNEFETLGWTKSTLPRTEYLSYMTDWKESWSGYGRSIKFVSSKLDGKGFTCYWAGIGKLWRITSCPFKEYGSEFHKYWSHIACANRNIAPLLVEEMERIFNKTIHRDENQLRIENKK
mmetsp:Transcript_7574/g.10990  ORF Transcript_7574/g.10990 Transcript_7574/m.10990 type:complete len:412 (+) Transcript_7574:131-1366(+)